MSRKREKVPRHVAGVTHMVAGPGPAVEWAGKTWRFGFNHQDAKGRLEELIRAHVVRDALRTKRALGGAEGQEAYDLTDAKVKGGHYLTFARGWAEVLNSPAGVLLYTRSLLQEHHPDVTDDDVRRMLAEEPEQTEAAVAAVSPDFFKAVAVQMGETPETAETIAAELARTLRDRTTPGPDTASPSCG